jgi:hypothetical protein
MSITDQTVAIINGCKNEQQTEVATKFVEALIKSVWLTRLEKNLMLSAIDSKLAEHKNELISNRKK